MQKGKLYITLSNGDLKCVTAEQKELLRIAKINHPDLEIDNYLFEYNLYKMAQVPAEMNYVVTQYTSEDCMDIHFATKEEADNFKSDWSRQNPARKLKPREYNEANRIFLLHNPEKRQIEPVIPIYGGLKITGKIAL